MQPQRSRKEGEFQRNSSEYRLTFGCALLHQPKERFVGQPETTKPIDLTGKELKRIVLQI